MYGGDTVGVLGGKDGKIPLTVPGTGSDTRGAKKGGGGKTDSTLPNQKLAQVIKADSAVHIPILWNLTVWLRCWTNCIAWFCMCDISRGSFYGWRNCRRSCGWGNVITCQQPLC